MEPQVGTMQAEEAKAETGDIRIRQTRSEAGEARTGQTQDETGEIRTGRTQDKTAQAGAVRVGEIVEGKVSAITSFGAFVALENRRSGLVHISEIANSYVNDVHDFLQEGQSVKALVLSVENGRINLSIKKALSRSGSPRETTLPPSGDQAFEDKLKRFLSSSEGKMADLNRSMDGKRGGRRRK